jgi:type IV pilus assembly protein PilP
MHAWIKIKTILLFGLAMALGCMGLLACQEPPPRQKVEPKQEVVLMKIPPSPPAMKPEPQVVDPVVEPEHSPVLQPEPPGIEKPSLAAPGFIPGQEQVSGVPIEQMPPVVASSSSVSGEEPSPPASEVNVEKPSPLASEVKLPFSTSFALEPYSPTDKINPFIPLIQTQPKATIAVDKREKKPTRTLTPLEKFDLSQIRLVAVVLAQSGKIAMVEEASGKGYVVRLGTYIGKDAGTVVQILTDRIVINEIITDFKGEEISRTREMKLHKQEIEG